MNTAPDKKLFIQLMQQNKRIIYKICNSYCSNKNDREDLAQEIVYNLWKSFPNYKSGLTFSTWMYRIALNVSISFYRKTGKEKFKIPISENLVVFDEDTEAGVEMENNLALLFSFINELKEIDKSIMLLYLDDKSYKEIAEITGITVSNVAIRINRIKDKLKTNFQTTKK